MYRFHYLIAIFILLGCIKESQTSYTAELVNDTNHSIVIEYFQNGISMPNLTIDLKPHNSVIITSGFDRGIVNNAGFDSEYFGDSAIVTFDSMYKMTHYFDSISNPSNKSYLYSSLRNLFNYLSYDYSYTDESKYKRNASYKYNFTEQDYIDAKP